MLASRRWVLYRCLGISLGMLLKKTCSNLFSNIIQLHEKETVRDLKQCEKLLTKRYNQLSNLTFLKRCQEKGILPYLRIANVHGEEPTEYTLESKSGITKGISLRHKKNHEPKQYSGTLVKLRSESPSTSNILGPKTVPFLFSVRTRN